MIRSLVLVALLLAIVSSSWALETIDSTGLWERYRSELFKFLRQGDKNAMPGLQLVSVPFPAEWDQNPEYLQEICSRIPQFKVSWELGSRRFQDEYYKFLMNLKLPPRGAFDESKLLKMQEKLENVEAKYQSALERCAMNFVKTFESPYASFIKPKTWEQYQQGCILLRTYADEKLMVLAEAEQARVQGFGADWDARAALGKLLSVPEEERDFYALGDLGRFVQEAQAGRTNAFEVKITSSTKIDKESTTQTSIGVGFSGAFMGVPVSVNGNYQKQEMKFSTSTDSLQIIFGAKGWKAIPVFPKRSWYSPSILEEKRNGPFKTPVQYFGNLNNKKSFESARMPLLPKTLFVVVAPQVEMFVSKEDASRIEKSSSFGLSVNVAGLDFNFQKGATAKVSQENSKLFKVTLTGDSATPTLLAVDNAILPFA